MIIVVGGIEMKVDKIPKGYEDLVVFACKVCRNKFRAETGRNTNCAWRACGGEVCSYMQEAIEQTERDNIVGGDICVACGGYADDGHLCWSCRQKAGG